MSYQKCFIYFNNVDTLEELRKQYKKLLKKFHPDNANGSKEITQEINEEYDKLFKILRDNNCKKGDNNNDYNNMKYDFNEDRKLREVLQEIIFLDNINIEIVGCWLWIDGQTLEYKNKLKSLGFKWAREKKKWYFHTKAFRKKSNKKLSFEEIKNYYGGVKVKPKREKEKEQLEEKFS